MIGVEAEFDLAHIKKRLDHQACAYDEHDSQREFGRYKYSSKLTCVFHLRAAPTAFFKRITQLEFRDPGSRQKPEDDRGEKRHPSRVEKYQRLHAGRFNSRCVDRCDCDQAFRSETRNS